MNQQVRPPAVAGRFYPGDPEHLRAAITSHLAEARGAGLPPKALIAPHAGYVYSGSVAGAAYARLASVRTQISRVVLLGPTHRVPLRGLGVSGLEAFETPLGTIPLETETLRALTQLPQVCCSDEAHAGEHSLEVHLPFLQLALDRFSLLPLVVGHASPAAVAEVLQHLWGGTETLVVISTDLSHFLPYETAQRLDAETCQAIERLRFEDIRQEQACGRQPVAGLLEVARRRGMRVETLALCNSGDTAGPRDQVVGYGAWALFE